MDCLGIFSHENKSLWEWARVIRIRVFSFSFLSLEGSHNGESPGFSYCLLCVLGRILWKILAQNLQQEKKKKLTNKAYEWTLFPKRAYLNRKQFWKYPPYYRQIPTELLTCVVSVRLSKELICCQTSSYQNSWQHSDFPGQSWNKQLIFHSPPIGRKKKTTHMWTG